MMYHKNLIATILVVCIFAIFSNNCVAQLIYEKEKIYSAVTLNNERSKQRTQDLIDQASSLDTLNIVTQEYDIESALWAVSQFLVQTQQSDAGIGKLVTAFYKLQLSTQRSLMEVLYGIYPKQYQQAVLAIAKNTKDKKIFAQAASYVYRNDATKANELIQIAKSTFAGYRNMPILNTLFSYLQQPAAQVLPVFDSLFAHQAKHGYKVIYSFQRANRNYPGLAIVQEADGGFAKDSTGKLRVFVQLARSASNLPYFITNGSTPQGVFAITGTGISNNAFIGPTPNLQMVMMHEVNSPKFTHYFPMVFNATPENIYRSYFPSNWQSWSGVMEAYEAGLIGRSEIIAHGTTINPEWFKGKTYYPISPTLGCLCGQEYWNGETGKIDKSDQLDLVNTFIETKGTQGYLMVINIDDKQAAVGFDEILALVSAFEANGQQ